MDNNEISSEELLKLHGAVESSGEAIFITDISGIITYINPEFTTLYGFTKEEVIGKVTPRILKSGVLSVEKYQSFWATLLAKKVIRGELINKTKDGRLITVEGSANPILNEKDEIIGFIGIQHDITLRKNVEGKLAQEQNLINAILNTLPDHVYFKDLESRFIRINRALALSLELENPEQAIGKTDFDFFSNEHAQQAFEDEQALINTGKLLEKEEITKKIDGHDIWVSTIKMPLTGKDGGIIGTFGISRDITAQKNSEQQLFLLANALKSINESVTITDIKDRVLFLNEAFIKTYGYTATDLIEESISLIRSENNPPEIVSEILPATISGGWKGELWNRRKDGSEFLVSLSTAAVRNDLGEPIALIGVATDITSKKRTELENQINYEITNGITSTSNLDELLKLIHQSLGKVVYAENCFVALFNAQTGLFSFPYYVDKFDPTPSPASMGKSCTAYVFRTEKPLLISQQIFDSLAEQDEVELVGSNSPSWIGIPLQSPSKIIGVMVLQHYEKENVYSELDIRFLNSIANQIAFAIERKISDEEILLKNELLQTLNAEKDKFFSIIAHDLRSPLSAFVEATQIISEEIHKMSVEEIREITLSMKSSATGIYSLLENLLEWSRMRRGGLDFLPEILNLKEKIIEYVNVLLEPARKKNVVITISIADDMVVFADNHMFYAIIRNLVSNAVKFTAQGGQVTISARVNIDNFVEVNIADSGIGISQDLKAKLFHISEKTSRKGTEGEPSTGLGLLLVKEFVEKHGGELWVESEVEKGSTFCFTIPNKAIEKEY